MVSSPKTLAAHSSLSIGFTILYTDSYGFAQCQRRVSRRTLWRSSTATDWASRPADSTRHSISAVTSYNATERKPSALYSPSTLPQWIARRPSQSIKDTSSSDPSPQLSISMHMELAYRKRTSEIKSAWQFCAWPTYSGVPWWASHPCSSEPSPHREWPLQRPDRGTQEPSRHLKKSASLAPGSR